MLHVAHDAHGVHWMAEGPTQKGKKRVLKLRFPCLQASYLRLFDLICVLYMFIHIPTTLLVGTSSRLAHACLSLSLPVFASKPATTAASSHHHPMLSAPDA